MIDASLMNVKASMAVASVHALLRMGKSVLGVLYVKLGTAWSGMVREAVRAAPNPIALISIVTDSLVLAHVPSATEVID